MSCLPDDIMESVISCVSAKETWIDLVHNFDGPSDTKENRIIDLKLKYQTFRAKSTESLSQTYTCYKTLLNELANDGVNLSKHEINVGFMNNLPEKLLTFSQGPRNANHTQTLELADIYERFVYEENLIQKVPRVLRTKDFPTKEQSLVTETFDWDEKEVLMRKKSLRSRGGMLAESSQYSESSIGVKCNTCRSTIHSATDHNEFDHFKRGEKIQAVKARV
nr:retrovirus-related Pol polyprotein from transposon TNT 1-94 [Tanacetum cinerariifolium]